MDAMLWEVLADGSPDDRVEVLIKMSDLGDLPGEAIEVVAKIGNIASCRIRRGDIETIRGFESVFSMKGSKTLTLDLPFSEDQIETPVENPDNLMNIRRPDVPFTGRGVAIGIADWGLDFTHPNFLKPDGSSRIIALWDQGADYDGENPYGFGTIFYREQINKALRTESPFQYLGYHPGKNDLFHQGMHGTHVLDIAAGNGSVGESGIAPEADLIGVHLATDKFKDLMGLGDSVRVFDAIHFLDQTAGNQPLVVNMSVGSHGDSHTGLSLIEQAIDHLVTSKDNRAVVQSCGNYYNGRTHAKGILSDRDQANLEWLISEEDKTPNEIEIWYDSRDDVLVDLLNPNGVHVLHRSSVGRSKIQEVDGAEIGRYYHRKNEPNTKLSQILIILNGLVKPGKWGIRLSGNKIVNGRFEAWIERDARSGQNQSKFPHHQADPNTTTGSICNGFFNICVGAYNANIIPPRVCFFSSSGPTLDGRGKPDLSAPGEGIHAAKSASPFQSSSEGELTYKTGTSMAAPFVSGAIALLFEASPRPLSIKEVKDKLAKACISPKTNDPNEGLRYGSGVLDIKQLFQSLENKQTSPSLAVKNISKINSMDQQTVSWESLMDSYPEEFGRQLMNNPVDFFESLPSDKSALKGFDIQRGDLLVRRQHAHHEPAWYGIVDFIINTNDVLVHTNKGTKKIALSKDGQRLDWEFKIIRPALKGNLFEESTHQDQAIEKNKIRFSQLLLRFADFHVKRITEGIKKTYELDYMIELEDSLYYPLTIFFDQNTVHKNLLPEVNNFFGHIALLSKLLKTEGIKWIGHAEKDALREVLKNLEEKILKLRDVSVNFGWKNDTEENLIKKIDASRSFRQSHRQELFNLLLNSVLSEISRKDRTIEGGYSSREDYMLFAKRLGSDKSFKKLDSDKKILEDIKMVSESGIKNSDKYRRFKGPIWGFRSELNELLIIFKMPEIEIIYEGEEIAKSMIGQLFGYQKSLMEDWHTALDVFEKVLSSPSSKDVNPNFDKVFWGFIKDKVVSAATNIVKHLPGGDFSVSVIELNKKFDEERSRAAKMKTDKALADFYVKFRIWIGDLKAELAKNLQKEQDRVEKEYLQIIDQQEKQRYLKKLDTKIRELKKERNAVNRQEMTIQLSGKWIEGHGGHLIITINKKWEIKEAYVNCPKGAQVSDVMRIVNADPFAVLVNKRVIAEAMTWPHGGGLGSFRHEHTKYVWLYPKNGYYSDFEDVFGALASRKFNLGMPIKWNGK